MPFRFLGRSVQVAAVLASFVAATTVVNVNGTASHAIPPLLYGQMFEDINSGDGGIYAELLQNRAFQHVKPNTAGALYSWTAVNRANIKVIADPSPISSALPNSLQLDIPEKASRQVGFQNEGYYGIRVNSEWSYNASFYYKFPMMSSFNGTATIALRSSTGEVYASASVPIAGSQTAWKQAVTYLTPTSSPLSTANFFTVTFDGAEAANQTIHFAMFSLFPPTFKDRQNGLRIDLVTALHEMKPSFFRLPGGNNLGASFHSRWIWNATLGQLIDRPGRMGDWGYINTDGLGLLEYLYMCEDLEMEPIMAVWTGYSFASKSLSESELTPYIQTAIDQINFVIGDPTTNEYAALRSSLGHPEPFRLNYVEIGNEDFFAAESYVYRWKEFANKLTETFPQLRFIATTYPFNPVLDPTPKYYDNHVYSTPDYFVQNAFYYDAFERNNTFYLQGEYAVTKNNVGVILEYPTIQSALGEAAYMTGFERNADIVFGASYSPLLMNIAHNLWAPNLVAFDASAIYLSSSYYVQQLFSTHRGTEYLPSTLPHVNGSLHWSVTRDANLGTVLFKVVNYGNNAEPITFNLPFKVSSAGNVTVISGHPDASNTPTTPNAVNRATYSVTLNGQVFYYTAPAWSVSALTAYLIT